MLKLGDLVDQRYELTEVVGRGGAGIVYKAFDKSLGRSVAIKFLHLSLIADRDSALRFRREAQVVARLMHPGIVRCYAFGFYEGNYYLVLEFVTGTTLYELLCEKALTWREACAVFSQLCDAMQYAHVKGIVHRDLNPKNIMLLPDCNQSWSAKILDFGLARYRHDGAAKLTLTGALIGTVHYMSPEQCRGEDTDSRSDIYALGCILYQCINGSPPFFADSPSVLLYMHANQPIPNCVVPDSSPGEQAAINQILATAMAKQPNDRYQTMNELKHDLNSVLLGEEITISNVSSASRKGLALPSLLMSAILALVACLILTLIFGAEGIIELCSELDNRLEPRDLSLQYAEALNQVGCKRQARLLLARYDIPPSASGATKQTPQQEFLSQLQWCRLYQNLGAHKMASPHLLAALQVLQQPTFIAESSTAMEEPALHLASTIEYVDHKLPDLCFEMARHSANRRGWLETALKVGYRLNEPTMLLLELNNQCDLFWSYNDRESYQWLCSSTLDLLRHTRAFSRSGGIAGFTLAGAIESCIEYNGPGIDEAASLLLVKTRQDHQPVFALVYYDALAASAFRKKRRVEALKFLNQAEAFALQIVPNKLGASERLHPLHSVIARDVYHYSCRACQYYSQLGKRKEAETCFDRAFALAFSSYGDQGVSLSRHADTVFLDAAIKNAVETGADTQRLYNLICKMSDDLTAQGSANAARTTLQWKEKLLQRIKSAPPVCTTCKEYIALASLLATEGLWSQAHHSCLLASGAAKTEFEKLDVESKEISIFRSHDLQAAVFRAKATVERLTKMMDNDEARKKYFPYYLDAKSQLTICLYQQNFTAALSCASEIYNEASASACLNKDVRRQALQDICATSCIYLGDRDPKSTILWFKRLLQIVGPPGAIAGSGPCRQYTTILSIVRTAYLALKDYNNVKEIDLELEALKARFPGWDKSITREPV